jgi:uncharacterized protein YutE (UPF0331/DUF86 family)
VNAETIELKLDSLERCLSRIDSKLPERAQSLEGDYDTQDIIAVNLERAIQQSVDIAGHLVSNWNEAFPAITGELFDRLAEHGVIQSELAQHLGSAVGLRNLAGHEYQNLDWQHLHGVLAERLQDFRDFSNAIKRSI